MSSSGDTQLCYATGPKHAVRASLPRYPIKCCSSDGKVAAIDGGLAQNMFSSCFKHAALYATFSAMRGDAVAFAPAPCTVRPV